MSANDDPLDLKFENDSCPGVSTIRRPGTENFNFYGKSFVFSFKNSWDKNEAPIYYVMPPSSFIYTDDALILSNIDVLPVSTCPNTHTIGERNSSFGFCLALSIFFLF